MNKQQLQVFLASDETAGRIIRDVAELEWEVDLLLTRYFTAHERFTEFSEIILSRFSFNQKIDILSKMSLPRKMKSQPNAVKSLRKFLKLRNMLAHSSYITDEDIHSIYSDNEIIRILADYPKSYKAEVLATKNRLNRLSYSYIVRMKKQQT